MRESFETGLSVVITLCAVLVASLYLFRFMEERGAPSRGAPEEVENWSYLRAGDLRIGSDQAAVEIVEFGDFQCPFCRILHEEFGAVYEESPAAISLVFRNYPLARHSEAEAAARSAICAARQGRFPDMAGTLFANQDSLGEIPWASLAAATVPDTGRFNRCLQDSSTHAALRKDVELAQDLDIRATPTVVINGWRLPFPPNADSLRRVLADVQAGLPPY